MRVLLIEDEQKVANFIARGLRAESYAVDVAYSGLRGWEMASAGDYDLIVLDLMLPGLSGTEVLRRIRKQGAGVPVLVLTARDAVAEKVENFQAGADDYLTKPFVFVEFLLRVKALLRRRAGIQGATLSVGDLTMDRLAKRVRRADCQIELTSKEYALLEYLMANAGRVLTRTMILQHVWDESFEGLTNIVDVYVRHLRAKLDDRYPTKLIRTVRGAGYSISAEERA